MQRLSAWVLLVILCAVSVSALGDGKWNYALYEQDPLHPPFDADSLSEEPGAQSTFDDFSGQVPRSSTNQAVEHNHDYYRVFLQSLSAKTVSVGIDCCFCKAQLNDVELVPELLPDFTSRVTLALEEGWNELEVDQLGDNPPSSKYSPFCDKELTLSRKLSELVDGLSSAPYNCDPANDCCKPDGSDLKEEGALCAEGDGQCDGNGKCSDPDGNAEECIEKFGDGAFLDSGTNKCCGDDQEKDCFSYNSGFFCQPGSGWQQLSGRVGQVLRAGCFGNANVVLDASEPKICFLIPPPLDYDFTYEVVSAKGNNKWKYFQNGQLKGEIEDKQFLATPFQAGTETKVGAFVHVTSNVAVELRVQCKIGPTQPGQPLARQVRVNDKDVPAGASDGQDAHRFRLDLNQGDNQVTIICKNNGFESGDKHIFLTPKLGDQVFSLSSKLPSGGMIVSEEFEATLQKRNESLGDVSDFADVPSGGGSSSPFDEEEDTTSDPNATATTKVLVRSADANISFQYQGNVSNPRLTGISGDLRAIYTGPPPQPPKGVFQRAVINNHGYLCVESVTDPDSKEVVECAGDPGLSKYFSKENAVQAKIGDARFALDDGGNNVIHWCSGFGPWVSDLDTRQTGHLTCESARTIQGVKSNFGFTGNRCCGDDPGEYYNDPFSEGFDKHGGCLGSKKVDFGDFPLEPNPQTSDEGVMTNYLGVFQGCGINQSDPLLGLLDVYTNQPLINQSPVCDVLEDARGQTDFFCSVEGKWQLSEDERPLVIVQTDDGKQGCCAADACFAGNQCISNQQEDPKFKVFNGQRCLNGTFVQALPKFRFDRGQKGFCPRDDQCLVNIDGNSANNDKPEAFFSSSPTNNPICIADKQFIMENVCENGEWTSRTKYIALQLEQLAKAVGGGYTIFCDKFDEVLNFFAYQPAASRGAVAREFLEAQTCKKGKCVNQFCGMAYKDGVAFGTSLNEDINSPVKSFLLALGLESTACDGVSKTVDHFEDCGRGARVYYNPVLNSVIYLPGGQLPRKTIEDLNSEQSSITGPFEQLAKSAKGSITPGDFVGRSRLFSRLFIDRRAEKEFFSFITEKAADEDRSNLPITYVGGWYNQIDVQDPSGRSPCQLISTVDTGVLAGSGFCAFDPSSKKLEFVRYSLGESPNPTVKNWRDLTAKFRNR